MNGLLDGVATLNLVCPRLVESVACGNATPLDGVLVEAAALMVVFLSLVDAETLALAVATVSFLPTSH